MVDRTMLLELANRIDACVEDAKRPQVWSDGYNNYGQVVSPAIISLAYGLAAISDAIRALAEEPR